MRAKICGIKNETDLGVAVKAGADAVGFISGVTHISEDAIDQERARELVMLVPPYVTTVLVTHEQEVGQILSRADIVRPDVIQLHGLVTMELIEAVREEWAGKLTRAVHITGPEAVEGALEVSDLCDAIHLDSRTKTRLGGTGQTHDWSISAEIVRELASRSVPCILAGGLSPGNLQEAMEAVIPFAVDVNTGVDGPSGFKDYQAARAFVNLAHEFS